MPPFRSCNIACWLDTSSNFEVRKLTFKQKFIQNPVTISARRHHHLFRTYVLDCYSRKPVVRSSRAFLLYCSHLVFCSLLSPSSSCTVGIGYELWRFSRMFRSSACTPNRGRGKKILLHQQQFIVRLGTPIPKNAVCHVSVHLLC